MNKRELAKINRETAQAYCKKLLDRPSDFGYFGNLDMFKTWSLGPIIEHRDSTLIDQSNASEIKKIFESHSEHESDWAITSYNHWAVGWVDHLSLRVYKRVLHTLVPCKVLSVWQDIEDRLADYPLLNEDDYSEREYNATLENIENAADYYAGQHDVDLPEDYASTLFSWFWDNIQSAVENTDDTGGYPSAEELAEAFTALNW